MGDDGNWVAIRSTASGGPYQLLQQVEYFIDYYLQFNDQYTQNGLPLAEP